MGNGDTTAPSDASNAGAGDINVQPTSFPPVDNQNAVPANKNIEFVLDIPLQVTVQIGSTRMLIRELLQLGQGSVIELNKLAGEPMEVLVNNKLVARGEVVVVNEKFGIRLTDATCDNAAAPAARGMNGPHGDLGKRGSHGVGARGRPGIDPGSAGRGAIRRRASVSPCEWRTVGQDFRKWSARIQKARDGCGGGRRSVDPGHHRHRFGAARKDRRS